MSRQPVPRHRVVIVRVDVVLWIARAARDPASASACVDIGQQVSTGVDGCQHGVDSPLSARLPAPHALHDRIRTRRRLPRLGLPFTLRRHPVGLILGALFGALTGVRIDGDGKVIAQFDNGIEKPIYQLPIATFLNPDGLRSLNGNAYAASVESGTVALKVASQGGAGSVQSSALEQSTVDLAKEFSDMIIIQRAYSAASKIITTADEMLDELTRLKR